MTALPALLLALGMTSGPPGLGSMIAGADAAFFRIDYPAALAAYDAALDLHPRSPDLLWRLARLHVCIAEVEADSAHDAHLRRAEEYARRCIVADSTIADGHTWYAAALGYRALDAAPAEKIQLSWALLAATDRALGLNPGDDAALSIRGSFYRALAGAGWLNRRLAALLFGAVPEGGFDEAESSLQRAMALAPDVMRHPYELAVLYLDADRVEEARRLLIHAASLPVKVAIDRQRLRTIRRLLEDTNTGAD